MKRQVLQTTPPSRMGAQQEAMTPGMEGVQPLAATPQGVEGGQQVATTPQGVEGAQQVATTPGGVEGAQQEATTPGMEGVQPLAATPLSGSGDHKRKAEEGQEQTKREKMETIEEEEEDGVKLVPLHRPEEEDIEEILKYV